MSEHDDTLLDGDFEEEEYDLGNDEEEALLADDYEVQTQSSYKGEEETDDVLDLGVTDALDDLEGDEEGVNYSSVNEAHNEYYDDARAIDGNYYENQDNPYKLQVNQECDDNVAGEGVNVENCGNNKPDLREKLQKNAQKDFFVGNGQGMEDDDCEEAKERRNRFQNERTIVSPKMNNDIPDSLENVVTAEQIRPAFRGRGRGRGIRGIRGGRFPAAPTPSNFSPRFNAPHSMVPFDNQRPTFRPPLLENRPLFPSGPRPNMPTQQLQFPLNNLQILQIPQFSQFPMNTQGPPQGHPTFGDNRPPLMPNPFQGLLGPPPGPRMMNRPDLNSRSLLMGPMYTQHNMAPRPHNPQFVPNQGHFQIQRPPMQSSQGPLIPGNPPSVVPSNPGPMMPGQQRMPMQRPSGPFMQRSPGPQMQGLMRPPMPNQNQQNLPNNSNVVQNMPNQIPFNNMQPYQDQHFPRDDRAMYDARPVYEQPRNQYINDPNQQPPPQPQHQMPQQPLPQTGPQPGGNATNMQLPAGHKILINPHFRGAVQPTTDARLAWDSSNPQPQQPPLPSGIANDQFNPPLAKFPDQGSYSQSVVTTQSQQPPSFQQTKSDDPYAYFSDVWQENKSQKTHNASAHQSETSYVRENYHGEYNQNYKSQSDWESRDSYQQGRDQLSYRDREQHQRSSVDRSRENRVPPTNSTYRSDSYNPARTQRAPSNRSPSNSNAARGPTRVQPKRTSDGFADRSHRDISPKRAKLNSRNLQEVKTVDTLPDTTSDKKETENEDPEMREYRKKLEEQKRAREKFLREKENRRKIAAMEKQYDEQKGEIVAAEEHRSETKSVAVVTGVAKDAKPRPVIGRGRSRPVGVQPTENPGRASGLRIVRTVQTVYSSQETPSAETSIEVASATGTPRKVVTPPSGVRRVVLQTAQSQKIATTIQKTVSNLQKGVTNLQKSGTQHTVGANPQQQTIMTKTAGSIQKTVINAGSKLSAANSQQIVVNAQNNQRVVLKKGLQPARKQTEIKTNVVRIDNLAASTSEAQLRRMCQGIGTLESIQMSEGSATIVFKTQSAALVFQKKYQRKMLDLSMVTVHLVSQTTGSKPIPTIVQKS